ncbi:MAG: hypothetical protein LBR19_07895 [Bifidobacteriaceae bacterium]|jgi:hypothetical protein|nr:hypothetical protein [Bifidobacteriaceae bacterium]
MFRIVVTSSGKMVSDLRIKYFASAVCYLRRVWGGDAWEAITEARETGEATRARLSAAAPGARTVFSIEYHKQARLPVG